MKLQICYTKKCEGLVRGVSDALYEAYGVRTFANAVLEPAGNTFDAKRAQYNAQALLEYLARVKKGDVALWLIDKDMYSAGMEYVFGYALTGYGAVLSSARLKTPALVQKEAVHEAGHIIGMKHCSNRCVMQYANTLTDAQAKPVTLCDGCRRQAKWPGVIKVD